MKKDSDNLDFLEQKARVYEKTNDLKLSVNIYNSLVKNQIDQKKSVYMSLVENLLQLEEYSQAKAVAKKGWRTFNDFQFKVYIAEIPTIQKKWKEAFKLWTKLEEEIGKESAVEEEVRLRVKFNLSIIKRIIAIDHYKKKIQQYRTSNSPKKYVIYTSYSKGYDQLKLPEFIDDRFDYVVFTDEKVNGFEIYDVRPLPSYGKDNARKIRYAKTHPHVLFPNYDAAIWLDASLLISGDIYPYLEKFVASGKPIASTPHQHRNNIFEEYEACVALKKDNPYVMRTQIERYKKAGFDGKILAENGVLMFNLRDKKLAAVLETWWQEILKGSKRDQLSFGYSLWKNKANWHHIIEKPSTVRNFPGLILAPHNKKLQVNQELDILLQNSVSS